MPFFSSTAKYIATALPAALLGGVLYTQPTQAQTLTVVDAAGHPVGVLTPAQSAAPPMFDAIDRMMDQEFAAMEAEQRQMMGLVNQVISAPAGRMPAPVRAVDAHGRMPQATMYQTVTTITWGANGTPCAQTISSSQQGQAAPIVQVATRGDSTCNARLSSGGVPVSSPSPQARTLTPAVDMSVDHPSGASSKPF
ncbi:hypothetical protein [Novacetimonas cocois]|uniref:Secreted protein n=1 Tax=Novacetimonas cocois TaxID=1747507 RepID=A0A365Z0J0_9PROT|nr:hypothetical protein [Novacetimonas cocois]RBM08277.1 hypothetical protein NJLHNGOC_05030 [Novacetimonas cocois]